jgi:hypothetical protein
MNIQEAAAASAFGRGVASALPAVVGRGLQVPLVPALPGEIAASQPRSLTRSQ